MTAWTMRSPENRWTGRVGDLGRLDLGGLLRVYFSHPAIWTYAALALVAVGLATRWALDMRPVIAALVVVAQYPVVEYLLHRFVLHSRLLYRTPATAALWKRIHFDHHQDPNRLDVLFGSLTNTLPAIGLVSLPIGWGIGGGAGAAAALAAGCLLMCAYEWLHCLEHLNYRPRSTFLRRMKRHHLAHHFHDERGNFGIMVDWIDRLAGTTYDIPDRQERSPTVFNLGYDEQEATRFPWVRRLSGLTVHRVVGTDRRFLGLPDRLHADDPSWIPPLRLERRQALSPRHNAWFAHGEAAFWLVCRDGRPVGRISAQVDRLDAPEPDGKAGHFGMLAAENDAKTVRLLTRTAEDWLRRRGVTRVTGPFSLSINEQSGLLVAGFDRPPTVMMPHDRPWLAGLLEQCGYAPCKELYAYRFDTARPPAHGFTKLAERPLPAGMTLRPLDPSRIERDIAAATAIFNAAWADNWGFIPLTTAETRQMARQLKPLLRQRLVWFIEAANQPAGFIVCLPDLNEMICDLDGKLLPFGWAKLLWRFKHARPRSSRIPLLGMRPEFRTGFVGSLMVAHLIDKVWCEAKAMGIEQIEFSWVLDDNTPMRRLGESLAGPPDKTYRLYEKRL